MTPGKRNAVFLVIIGGLIVGATTLPTGEWLQQLSAVANRYVVAGPASYILFVVLATVMFLPGSMALMLGGYLFGLFPGFLYAAIAIPVGSQAAFLFSRLAARPLVRARIAESGRLLAIEAALHAEAKTIVLLSRLSLLLPYNLLNYVYGATSIRPLTHFLATAIGMLPAIALWVYVGSLARDIGQIVSGEALPSDFRYWILGSALLAIVAATFVIQRAATRALQNHLAEQEPD